MHLVLADMGHLWEHQQLKNRHLPAREYSLRVGEVLRGRVFAGLDDAGQPLALGGIYDAGDGWRGFPWLSVVPGGLGSEIIPAVRHMRRVIGWALGDFPQGLACEVDDRNANGQRLARALGFAPSADRIGTLRQWDYIGDGRRHQWPAGAPADADGARGAAGPAQQPGG
jgi:hypothetical protein